MALPDYSGMSLGTRTVKYGDREAILYALAVGAGAGDLELVYERRLKVLPTFGLTLGLWAADAVSALGAYDPTMALHAGQALQVFAPLPGAAEFEIAGRVDAIWDKGKAALMEVVAECEYFRATYSLFLPGLGGWGGEAGPRATDDRFVASWRSSYATSTEQAALYRLTGDRHLIHIDPDAARGAGLPRPILHGLCTLGIAAREVGHAVGARPWELTSIEGRFSAPVVPGDELVLEAEPGGGGTVRFSASTVQGPVFTRGRAVFGQYT